MTFPHLRGKQPWMFTCSRYLPFSLWRHHRKCLWMHFILHSNKVHFFFFTKEESKVFSDFCQLAGCRELFPSHVYWCICSEVSCFIHKVAQRKETMEVQGYCGTWCLYTVSWYPELLPVQRNDRVLLFLTHIQRRYWSIRLGADQMFGQFCFYLTHLLSWHF